MMMNLKQEHFDIAVDINGSAAVLVEGANRNNVKASTWRKGFTPTTVAELLHRVMVANAEVAELQAAIKGTLTLINETITNHGE